MSILRAVSLSLVLIAGTSGVAAAQDAHPGTDRGGQTADRGDWDPAAMRRHEDARRAEHAKALHAVLGIQPSQEAAFTTFTTAMTPPDQHDREDAGADGRGDRTERDVAMTMPERLDRMKARMERKFVEMRQSFERRAQATKTLYAALDPRQRAAMDALPELSGHRGGGEHMRHMGMGR